jgi:magnesium transporter
MEFKIDYIIDDIKDFIELCITNGENHTGKTTTEFAERKKLSHVISNLHASDQTIIFTKLKEPERKTFVQEFTSALHEDIILFLETNLLYEFLNIIGLEKFIYFVAMLEFDEIVEILEKLDDEHQETIMKVLPFKKRIQLKRALSYPDYSCGRSMSIDYLSVPYWWTVARTKKYIKDSKAALNNSDDTVYVTDEERRVIGKISTIKLLNEEPSNLINACFDKEIITVKVYDSIPDIAYMFDQYDLDTIPVINKQGNIVGVLEISDVIDYVQEQSDAHILKSVGVFKSKTNTVFGIAKVRFLWLALNFCTAVFASYFISLFEDSIAKVTTLAVLMPIVSTMGGNCGSQTATVIIRSIFISSVTKKQMISEILIGMLNGFGLAIFCFLGVWLFYSNITLAWIFGTSIIVTLTIAGICGVAIPLTLNRLKIDPPVGTSIIITTITDIAGFVTILSLGTIFLIK